MVDMRLPEEAELLLNILNQNGFSAYVVGGCVRDRLRGVEPHDWDICTSAKPDEIKQVFSAFRTIDTGISHGTITVVMEDSQYEVTTLRIDGDYTDSRHPDIVSYTDDIIKDLSRRDFTINAMAYSPKTGLVDPFGGKSDIDNKIIRCVGDPLMRFLEDALRIMRALRFASTLQYNIDDGTHAAIIMLRERLHNISKERIAGELNKILLGVNAVPVLLKYTNIITTIIPEFLWSVGFDQKNPHHIYDVYEHIVRSVGAYDGDDLSVKLALFFHDIGKPFSETEAPGGISHFFNHHQKSKELAEGILKRLRYDNKTICEVLTLIEWHDRNIAETTSSVKRAMNRIGEKQFDQLLAVKFADSAAKEKQSARKGTEKAANLTEIFEDILLQNMCFTVKDMKIDGNDIIKLGVPTGRKIGEILNTLLGMILDDEIENKRDILLKEAELLAGTINSKK